ncbi:MAG: DUF1579 domain-containing protein [Pirellulales bacterium]
MLNPQPQSEHEWLQQLVGEWTFEAESSMCADRPTIKTTGTECVRSLGGLWTIGEGQGGMPGGGIGYTIMTLGFDPTTGRFVGTFIGSMMTHFWIYNGTLDESRKILALDTQGPDFSGAPGLVDYQDRLEIISPDHRKLSAYLRGSDGQWQQFMESHYHRQK